MDIEGKQIELLILYASIEDVTTWFLTSHTLHSTISHPLTPHLHQVEQIRSLGILQKLKINLNSIKPEIYV